MRLKGLDINLLVVLDVLLTERNVTAAARRLNMSQPAASSALARLRDFFGDELLVQSGRSMLPTAHALSLRPLVRELLGTTERIIATTSSFDPATAERTFRITGSDYIYITLLAPLIARLQAEAPAVRFEAGQLGPAMTQALERGEIDLLLTPRHFISPDHPAVLVFEEQHVVVGWNRNPIFEQPLTLQTFLDAPQVAIELGATRARPFAEEQMQAQGLRRRIEVVAPSFGAVPWLLPGSTRIAVLHERLALQFARALPLAIAPLPFAMPVMEEMAQFHATRERDPGLRWLLGRMQELTAEIPLG